MTFQFTPGAERVLDNAAVRQFSEGGVSGSSSNGESELSCAALLVGLLMETECRAALLLQEQGISCERFQRDWPEFASLAETALASSDKQGLASGKATAPWRFTPELVYALRDVERSLALLDQSPIFATEHLLWGLLRTEEPVTKWLERNGVSAEGVQEKICLYYGCDPRILLGPTAGENFSSAVVPLDFPAEADADASNNSIDVPNAVSAANPQADDFNSSLIPHPSSFSLPLAPSSLAPDPRPLPPDPRPLTPAPSSNIPTDLLRALDACANRAREGLRVIEDYARFFLDDRFLTGQCKAMRHELVEAMQYIPTGHLLASRETESDVGTTLSHQREASREDIGHLVTANCVRLQESLRSLEEFGKLVDPALGEQFKRLRYRSYTLHRALDLGRSSLERLKNARLYVLIDGRATLTEFIVLADSLVAAGVPLIQLRDKKLDDRTLLERARTLRKATAGTATLFIVNDRPDLAVLACADGVHVGQEELSVKDVRRVVGPEMLIGVSCHSVEEARRAVLEGANNIGVGPTFPSVTKEFDVYHGLDLLKDVAAETRLPAFAIGGIDLKNLDLVLATGIGRVAVASAVTQAENPASAAKEFLKKLS